MLDTSFLFEALADVLISLVSPVVIGISMFILWRCLRRAGNEGNHAFGVLAKGFCLLFLSIALPLAIAIFAFLVLGDSADNLSEMWFSVPAALFTVAGTVYTVLGTRELTRQVPPGD